MRRNLYARVVNELTDWPSVKYLPEWLASFKRQAREWRTAADAMLNEPFEITKAAMARRQSDAIHIYIDLPLSPMEPLVSL